MEGMRKVEVLRAACCVAGIDGETSDAERAILEKLAGEVGVGEVSLAAMIDRAETEKKFYEEQFRVLKADPKETLQTLFRVSVADGKLGSNERIVLRRLAAQLGVPEKQFDHWLAQVIQYLAGKAADA